MKLFPVVTPDWSILSCSQGWVSTLDDCNTKSKHFLHDVKKKPTSLYRIVHNVRLYWGRSSRPPDGLRLPSLSHCHRMFCNSTEDTSQWKVVAMPPNFIITGMWSAIQSGERASVLVMLHLWHQSCWLNSLFAVTPVCCPTTFGSSRSWSTNQSQIFWKMISEALSVLTCSKNPRLPREQRSWVRLPAHRQWTAWQRTVVVT